MNRRAFLGIALAVGGTGCIGRPDGRDGARNDTRGDSDLNSTDRSTATPRPSTLLATDTAATTHTAPPTFTPQSDRKTETRAKGAEGPPLPVLVVRHSGPLDADAVRVMVTITSVTGESVFERIGTLEPGESVAFDDVFGGSGRYRLTARLENGTTTTKTVRVPDGGVPGFVGYAVDISFGDIEIRRAEI